MKMRAVRHLRGGRTAVVYFSKAGIWVRDGARTVDRRGLEPLETSQRWPSMSGSLWILPHTANAKVGEVSVAVTNCNCDRS